MEHHECKQSCRRSDGENTRKLVDRLSSLPHPILAEILSFLPLKTAVAPPPYPGGGAPCGAISPSSATTALSLPASTAFQDSLETLILGIGFDLKLADNGIRLPNLKNLRVHSQLVNSQLRKGTNGFNRSKTVAVGNDATWSGKRSWELIQSVHSVRSLTICGDICFSPSNSIDGRMPIFESLTNLTGILSSSTCWEGSICLVQRCPILQVLVVKASFYGYMMPLCRIDIVRITSTCLSSIVKTIRLKYLEGHERELELVTYVASRWHENHVFHNRAKPFLVFRVPEYVHETCLVT
ncbi:hypothetical protein Cgig2_026848 [Carnegiea gigantea]|uniref:Uncharacterized protein n=1 Tax=Carnegiea gigantea TaxID=171969 RepID=A0A9Q1KWN6_9CARY|nr:hypothetical protein Cgig2_026848 [Carnegiea gigantea]